MLKQYAEVELLSEIESQIRNSVVLSIADIEVTYKNILEEYGIYEDLSVYYQRRYLKDLILGSISHAKCVAQKDPSKPHIMQSSILDTDLLTAAMDNAEKNGSDMRCIFKAANIVRKSILNFRKDNPPITNDCFHLPRMFHRNCSPLLNGYVLDRNEKYLNWENIVDVHWRRK